MSTPPPLQEWAEREDSGTQPCFLLTNPLPNPGGAAGACTRLVPGPASTPVGLRLKGREGGGTCLSAPPSLREGQESSPLPATILQRLQKQPQNGGSPGWTWDSPGIGALYLACFSYNHSRWQQQRTDMASLPTPSPLPVTTKGADKMARCHCQSLYNLGWRGGGY